MTNNGKPTPRGTGKKKRKGPGRPRTTDLERGKIPPEVLEEFYADSERMPAKTAVKLAPFAWETCRNWMRRGAEQGEGPNHEFLVRTTRARAKFKATLENQACVKRPEWMLAMLYPKEYSLKQHIEANVKHSVAEFFRSAALGERVGQRN